jgi:phospholipase C
MPGIDDIEHFFVLMLENRSFDHMLGFMPGVNGLEGTEANWRDGLPRAPGAPNPVTVSGDAPYRLRFDPGHEFDDVRVQLMGRAPNGTLRDYAHDPVTMAGFVQALGPAPADEKLAMRCFDWGRLPVLHQLACEFAVCDHWFSSMPGSTWPNRFFAHAGTSGGLFDGPSDLGMARAYAYRQGYKFEKGTVFSRLKDRAKIYSDTRFPQALSLADVRLKDVGTLSDLFEDLARPVFDKSYVFIEPRYDAFNDFIDGSSQHPLGSVAVGERLIKEVYENLRNSAIWEVSALIITYDEHGGFYDHFAPPQCVPPGDRERYKSRNIDRGDQSRRFDFSRLGVRVPTVIVSPLIPRGTVDPTIYDHTSIPATILHRFTRPALTKRDANAKRFDHLFKLTTPRDTPEKLNDPLEETVHALDQRPGAPLNTIQTAFLDVAKRADVLMAQRSAWPYLEARWQKILTASDAEQYMREVESRIDSQMGGMAPA